MQSRETRQAWLEEKSAPERAFYEWPLSKGDFFGSTRRRCRKSYCQHWWSSRSISILTNVTWSEREACLINCLRVFSWRCILALSARPQWVSDRSLSQFLRYVVRCFFWIKVKHCQRALLDYFLYKRGSASVASSVGEKAESRVPQLVNGSYRSRATLNPSFSVASQCRCSSDTWVFGQVDKNVSFLAEVNQRLMLLARNFAR